MEQVAKLVKFNVGGIRYTTSYSTLSLRGENFLTKLVDNDIHRAVPCVRDEEGNIFIDRDGELFGVVLNFLRTGHLLHGPNVSQKLLKMELDFYQIPMSPQQHGDEGAAAEGTADDPLGAAVMKWRLEVDELVSNIGEQIEAAVISAVEQGNTNPHVSFVSKRPTSTRGYHAGHVGTVMYVSSTIPSTDSLVCDACPSATISQRIAASGVARGLMEQHFNSNDSILSKHGSMRVSYQHNQGLSVSLSFVFTLELGCRE